MSKREHDILFFCETAGTLTILNLNVKVKLPCGVNAMVLGGIKLTFINLFQTSSKINLPF